MDSMDELRSPSRPTSPAAPIIVFPSPSMLSVLQLLGTIRCPKKPRAAHLDMRSERDRLLKVIEEQATSMHRLTDLRPPAPQPEQAAGLTEKPARGDECDRWRVATTERRSWWPFGRRA